MRSVPAVPLFLAAAMLFGSVAGAVTREEEDGARRGRSRAVGSAAAGVLVDGTQLRPTPYLYFKDGSPPEERWGTDELVGLVERSAEQVGTALPEARLTVGDLSLPTGGRMRPHLTHTNGRDVDVGFYYRDAQGATAAPRRFVRVRRDGRAAGHLRFDAARNWKLVESMLTDPRADVEQILVASHLERALLAEARRQGAAPWLYERARLVMYQPRRGGRHDDHFHVRIHCPPDDRPQCQDGEHVMPVLPPFRATR